MPNPLAFKGEMSLRRGWTLMEMIVTIGVTGVLLAFAVEITILTMRATYNMQKNIELHERAVSLMERVLGEVLRAEGVKVDEMGLAILTEGQEIIVSKEFRQGNISGEWTFEWVKENLLRLKLKVTDERGKDEIVWTEVFVPLCKRGEGE